MLRLALSLASSLESASSEHSDPAARIYLAYTARDLRKLCMLLEGIAVSLKSSRDVEAYESGEAVKAGRGSSGGEVERWLSTLRSLSSSLTSYAKSLMRSGLELCHYALMLRELAKSLGRHERFLRERLLEARRLEEQVHRL